MGRDRAVWGSGKQRCYVASVLCSSAEGLKDVPGSSAVKKWPLSTVPCCRVDGWITFSPGSSDAVSHYQAPSNHQHQEQSRSLSVDVMKSSDKHNLGENTNYSSTPVYSASCLEGRAAGASSGWSHYVHKSERAIHADTTAQLALSKSNSPESPH